MSAFTDAEMRSMDRQTEAAIHEAEFVKRHPEWADAQALHPLFAAILGSHGMLAFRARVGKKPAFRTSAEQVAYERAFLAFPDEPWGLPNGAAMDGFRDAQEEHMRGLTGCVERRVESNFGSL